MQFDSKPELPIVKVCAAKIYGRIMKIKNRIGILNALLAVLVTLTGIAAANPFDLILNQGSPNQNLPEPNDILLVPGVEHISSLFGQKFLGDTPQTFALNPRVTCYINNTPPLDTACHADDLVIKFNNVTGIIENNTNISFGPIMDNNVTFLAVDALSITLKENPQDPLDTNYTITVFGGPGTTSGETASASRTLTSAPIIPTPTPPIPVPEYSSVGLPIAMIFGLVFFLVSRRKQN